MLNRLGDDWIQTQYMHYPCSANHKLAPRYASNAKHYRHTVHIRYTKYSLAYTLNDL